LQLRHVTQRKKRVKWYSAKPLWVVADCQVNYPIVLNRGRPVAVNRFWAIPIVGILVKAIILIPHFIVLYVLGIVVGLAQLVIWAFVLFTGQYPEWGFNLTAGVLRWWARLLIYLYGLSDDYPAFSTEAPGDIAVPDTNVLLHDPNSLLNFADNNVLLPIEVIEEIDRFKRESTELGQNARTVSRMLTAKRARERAGWRGRS